MIKMIDIEIGQAAWSKVNPLEITWICANVGRSGDQDIVLDFIEMGKSPCSIASGTKIRMYLSEAMEHLTLKYFDSAQYKKITGGK